MAFRYTKWGFGVTHHPNAGREKEFPLKLRGEFKKLLEFQNRSFFEFFKTIVVWIRGKKGEDFDGQDAKIMVYDQNLFKKGRLQGFFKD